jgi:hypothetical protein
MFFIHAVLVSGAYQEKFFQRTLPAGLVECKFQGCAKLNGPRIFSDLEMIEMIIMVQCCSNIYI